MPLDDDDDDTFILICFLYYFIPRRFRDKSMLIFLMPLSLTILSALLIAFKIQQTVQDITTPVFNNLKESYNQPISSNDNQSSSYQYSTEEIEDEWNVITSDESKN